MLGHSVQFNMSLLGGEAVEGVLDEHSPERSTSMQGLAGGWDSLSLFFAPVRSIATLWDCEHDAVSSPSRRAFLQLFGRCMTWPVTGSAWHAVRALAWLATLMSFFFISISLHTL